MKKIILAIVVMMSLLHSDNDISILNSNITSMLLKGNGEECKVYMSKTGILEGTTCLQITNSKGIKILCTAKKKMCKTVDEMRNALNVSTVTKLDTSGLKNLYQGMKYSQAREIILNAGYQGIRTRWQDVSEYGQDNDIYYNNGWQEVVSCAGTGTAPCRFEFQDINRKKLVVITEGECLTKNFESPKKGEKCDVSVSQWFFE